MKPVMVLIVLDGWGIGQHDASNPMRAAKLPTFDWLYQHFPTTSLQASGISVGLPWGETSNSEVGHLTIGAGKIIYQYYPRIILGIRDQSFFGNQALLSACEHARKNQSAVNIMGLLSKGNVHASIEHLRALVKLVEDQKVPYKLHLWADGKDCSPKTFEEFILNVSPEKIATIIGRYYAMDHGRNWRSTERAYQGLTTESAELVSDVKPTLYNLYDQKLSEEFLPPLRLQPGVPIQDNESIIFFNFREDGVRQLAEAFLLPNFDKFPVKKFQNLHIVTMTRYEDKFTAPVAFPPDEVKSPLGKVLADNHLSQLRLSETYKYAHVTYFFNGYEETPYPNEYRILVPSLTTPHLSQHPEMMATAITDRALAAIQDHSFDFILINYANGDMIAHTGDYEAGVKAAEVVDREIGRILKVALAAPANILITADHGNLEEMYNPLTGRYETQHDPSPVPCYLIGPGLEGKKFINQDTYEQETLGILSDVAPTILHILGLSPPEEMTGHNLLEKLS
jgi:2,3-bisphosphoglycerate-independent phosphoglycerate mutase